MGRKLEQEDVIRRFKDVHGDKWDYSKAVYKGKDSKVIIGCPIHGDFLQSPHNHYKGQGCPVCGDLKQAKNNTRTAEEYIAAAKDLHGETYLYDKTNYTGNKCRVTITCRTHGDFVQSADSHLQGHGCKRCFRERLAQSQLYSTEEYIRRAKEAQGSTYDYSQTVYTNSTEKVAVICREHGVFHQQAASHLMGFGCPACAIAFRSELKTKNTEEFLKDAVLVHNMRYDYSRVEYEKCDIPIEIVCKEHGVFMQKPSSHLSGQGCPKCSVYGFDLKRSGFLYVLSCGDMTKVGITNRDARTRAAEISKSFGAEFSVIRTFYFNYGTDANSAETLVLSYLRERYKNPKASFDGKSESFMNVDRNDLHEAIQRIISEVEECV